MNCAVDERVGNCERDARLGGTRAAGVWGGSGARAAERGPSAPSSAGRQGRRAHREPVVRGRHGPPKRNICHEPWQLQENLSANATRPPPPPLCDIPSGCCSFTGPWTVTRSSLRMLRRVAAFCWLLRPVLLLVLFPRLRSPVVGVPGLCGMWHGVPFARQRRPIIGVLRMCWLFDCFCCPRASVHRPSVACLAVFLCA